MRRYALVPVVTLTLTLTLTLASGGPAPVRAQDVPEMSPEALAAFAEGMALYTALEYEPAAQAFARAHELDPSFAVAAFFESLNWGNAGDTERALEAIARAAEGADRMSPYYRHRVAAQEAGLRGDRATALAENRKAVELAPGSKAGYNVALGLARLRQPRAAVEILSGLDPDRPPMKGWLGYWSVLGRAQHQAGLHEEELRTAQGARERFADRSGPYWLEAESLIALGRSDEVAALVDAYEGLEARFDIFLVNMAAEAEVHGQPELAEELLDRAMEHYAALPEEVAAGDNTRLWKAITHYTRGELAEAETIFGALAAEDPDDNGRRAWVAVVAAERGDAEAAEVEIQRLTDPSTDGDPGTLSIYAASIAAALGDGDRFGSLIDRAMDAGSAFSVWDHKHPAYRKVREHPKYVAFSRPGG